ncbi:MerR family DNA-binding transcriptional regulator [Paenibacillus sp. NEAU-GSW1]|uniref:MerR family DNA-binding transcriptional regulator n=1 Tax=Paenibacillus sp. NEAU-GSW1 TaxID=2682486 RepID=UPI0012E1321B|nr:MerR family DNA-binding transcriptional regulator [Paenibacillus sp. NEAU-GSW1]MUT68557.1 MerR family DNA-binding transcriptional regulator [Paenibacillus sp. NEAU-GSW1]
MEYTIKQVSERTQLPASTLRYYDKEGLMPLLKRTDRGTRKYSDWRFPGQRQMTQRFSYIYNYAISLSNAQTNSVLFHE